MPIIVQCPNPACRQSCSVAESLSGQPVRCANCGKPFAVKPTFDGQTSDTNKPQPPSNTNPFPVLPAEFGRYRVLKLLGKGGMGAVYLAEDSQLGRQVALKIPFFDAAESPQRAERFVREARSAAALHHPNICTVFDAGQIDGRPFLTMAYISGTPLEDEIDPDTSMPQVRAAEIARKVALALEQAHRKGVVHRDLKPANVMMDDEGEPVVMDFGLAKRFGDVGPDATKLTHAGTLLGTPSYMSPEQVRGKLEDIGPATDVYSLGVVLFEMLTGHTPYRGAFRVILGQILAAPVPPVQEFWADVDARLDAICQKAMAKKPAARFVSMAEFADALGQYLKAPSSSPPPLPAPVAIPVAQAASPVVDRSPFDDLVAGSASAPAAKKAKTRREAAIALALALLVPLGCWLAIVMLRVETANGTLVVEMHDDEVEARIKNGKLILSGPDGKVRYILTAKDRSKKLEVGPCKIRVEGADGLVLDTPEFTIKKGGKVKVRVTMGQPAVVRNAPAPLDPDRKADDKGLEPLFNGKDLTGWEGLPGYWRVEGGAIVGSITKDPGFNTFLCSKKSYSDFELRCQVRLKGGIGNSGVHVRSKVIDGQKFIVAGPQCDMGANYWGSLYGERFGGTMKQSPPDLVKTVVKNDDFNDYYIKCVGKHVTIKINGETMVDGDFPAVPEEGIIAWQLHTGFKSMEVAFKDIQFTDLSKPRADGFVPLFNGKDLTGWKTHPDDKAKWEVKDGILIGSGPIGQLFSERGDYENFHFRLEAMINDHGNSGQYFRTEFAPRFPKGYEAQINSTARDPIKTGSLYNIVNITDQLHKPDEWLTQEVIAEGGHIVIKVNGKTVVDTHDLRYKKGHFALQQHDPATVVKFRKVEVKELPTD